MLEDADTEACDNSEEDVIGPTQPTQLKPAPPEVFQRTLNGDLQDTARSVFRNLEEEESQIPAGNTTETRPKIKGKELLKGPAEDVCTEVENGDCSTKGTGEAEDMIELREEIRKHLSPLFKPEIFPSQEGSDLLQKLDDKMCQLLKHPPQSYKSFRDAEFNRLLQTLRLENRYPQHDEFNIKERVDKMIEQYETIRCQAQSRILGRKYRPIFIAQEPFREVNQRLAEEEINSHAGSRKKRKLDDEVGATTKSAREAPALRSSQESQTKPQPQLSKVEQAVKLVIEIFGETLSVESLVAAINAVRNKKEASIFLMITTAELQKAWLLKEIDRNPGRPDPEAPTNT